MVALLQMIDIYSIETNLLNKGNQKKSTGFGVCISIISFATIAFFSFMFGADLIYKQNPKLLSTSYMPKDYKYLEVDTYSFPILFKVTNIVGNPYPQDKMPVFPMATVKRILQDENGSLIQSAEDELDIKPCLETDVVNRTELDFINLNEFYCLDYTKVNQREKIELGGFYDTKVTNLVGLTFYGCKYENGVEVKCHSHEEMKEKLGLLSYAHVIFPSAYLDVDSHDEPLKMTFESVLYPISPEVKNNDRIFYKFNTIKDDKGWIFEDIVEHERVSVNETTSQFSLIHPDKFDGYNSMVYSLYFYVGKEATTYKRSYMKIQEVGAMIGGFIKVLTLSVTLLTTPIVRFIRDRDIIFDLAECKDQVLRQSYVGNNSTVSKIVASKKNKNLISFMEWAMSLFSRNKPRKVNAFQTAKQELFKKLDIYYYLEICTKLDKLTNPTVNTHT